MRFYLIKLITYWASIIRLLLVLTSLFTTSDVFAEKLKLAVIGLTHTHVHWIFESEKRGDFEIVAVVEPNHQLAERYAKQHGFSLGDVYPTMDDMFAQVTPVAVAAFGSIYQHLEVVQQAAPRGIHVMVEKPLAVSLEHAKQMQQLALKHNIHLLTNYETTWYPSNHHVKAKLDSDTIGEVRKVIVNSGHKGPKKLGINQEFLDWLLDPKQNGGGAIMDFACYGANLMTWLMDGQAPTSVMAVTQQLQKDNNPLVDDEATVILTYPTAQAVVQGSWNWPMGRKDMQVYGLNGALYADDRQQFRQRLAKGYDDYDQTQEQLASREYPYDDPFSYFKAVIDKTVTPSAHSLSSLENNMTVMRILDAAKQSALSGKRITLK